MPVKDVFHHAFEQQHHEECCALSVPLTAIVAVLLSITAALMAMANRQSVDNCLAGLGEGAGPLQSLMNSLAFNYTFAVLLNLFSAFVLLLSHFAMESVEGKCVEKLTSSKVLCWLHGLTWFSFALQLFRLGYAFSLHGTLAFLATVCNMGPGVVYLAQQLIYAMDNATITSSTPYGGELQYGYHVASSMYVSTAAMTHKLDLVHYCKLSDEGRDGSGFYILLGCLMTVVSQAMMASALSGEKDRVGVHEEHEHHALESMASVVTSETDRLVGMGSEAAHDVMQGHMPHNLNAIQSEFQHGAGRLAGKFSKAASGSMHDLAAHMPGALTSASHMASDRFESMATQFQHSAVQAAAKQMVPGTTSATTTAQK